MPTFTSSAVMYVPSKSATNRPIASKSGSDLSPGSATTTDLPPPSPVCATADLYVIARESLSTSSRAASSLAYGHSRMPPSDGPSRVEWTLMYARSPLSSSSARATRS